jgi:hypothetical protein
MVKPRASSPDRKTSNRKANVVFLRDASRGARLEDPAAAPVGTDAEAAGMSSAAEQAASAAHADMTRKVYSRDPAVHGQNPVSTATILIAIALAGIATVFAILWTRA